MKTPRSPPRRSRPPWPSNAKLEKKTKKSPIVTVLTETLNEEPMIGETGSTVVTAIETVAVIEAVAVAAAEAVAVVAKTVSSSVGEIMGKEEKAVVVALGIVK